jgi:Protein of unknown function (DUF2884)
MKSNRLLYLALLAALLAACSADNTAQTVEGIKTDVANGIEADMDKAIAEAKADLTDIDITLQGGGKAKIAANGDLSIDGKPIALNPEQRALTRQYYAATRKIAMQGLEIGKQSAKLATQAIGSAIGGIINGKNEADIEKSIEAKAGDIEAVATKLCDSALELKAIQEALTAAVPEFKAEPMTVDSGKDGCSVHSGTDGTEINLGVGDGTPPEPPAPPPPPEPPKAPEA